MVNNKPSKPAPLFNQVIKISIGGKTRGVRVLQRADGVWAAGVRLKINRSTRDVVETGPTKESAIHKMMSAAAPLVA